MLERYNLLDQFALKTRLLVLLWGNSLLGYTRISSGISSLHTDYIAHLMGIVLQEMQIIAKTIICTYLQLILTQQHEKSNTAPRLFFSPSCSRLGAWAYAYAQA